jgi:N-acetylglucosaminyldiphosphoundecaprenol N-acetyl-beta-D-mannosaminyltransferase
MAPPSRPKFHLGRIACSPHARAELLNEIRARLEATPREGALITFVNAYVYNLARRDERLAKILEDSTVTAADGMSVVWSARLMGTPMQERCGITEVFTEFLASETMPPTRALLIGASPEDGAAAAAEIARRSPRCRVVRSVSGYLADEDYRKEMLATGPVDLVLIGTGTPKSEHLGVMAREVRPEAIAWHVGGGTIMFLAGKLREAPKWMRRSGLQWLHRLLIEPRRMWRRYLIGNVQFAWSILGVRLRKSSR